MRKLLSIVLLLICLCGCAVSSHKSPGAPDPALLRYADSIASLGSRLYAGDSLLKADPDSSLILLEEAAALGHPRAANNLAYLLLYGDSARRDPGRAAELFRMAADAGLPTAMAQLADLYRQGLGLPADTLKADSLYLLAAGRGLEDADYKLTAMMMPVWQTLAPDSLLQLGRIYYAARANTAAVSCLNLAIRDIDALEENVLTSDVPPQATALAILGDAYAHGRGVPYNFPASLASFLRAARLGDPSAQYIIAETLDLSPDALAHIGVGGDDPDADAQRWYILAARKGITDARTAYRRLF